jgi:hypothetical protein
MRALSKRHALSLLALHNPVDPIDEWRERTRGLYPDTELFVQPAFGLQARAKRTAQLRSLFGLRSWDAISHRNEAMVSCLRERLARETPWSSSLRKWPSTSRDFRAACLALYNRLARRATIVVSSRAPHRD